MNTLPPYDEEIWGHKSQWMYQILDRLSDAAWNAPLEVRRAITNARKAVSKHHAITDTDGVQWVAGLAGKWFLENREGRQLHGKVVGWVSEGTYLCRSGPQLHTTTSSILTEKELTSERFTLFDNLRDFLEIRRSENLLVGVRRDPQVAQKTPQVPRLHRHLLGHQRHHQPPSTRLDLPLAPQTHPTHRHIDPLRLTTHRRPPVRPEPLHRPVGHHHQPYPDPA